MLRRNFLQLLVSTAQWKPIVIDCPLRIFLKRHSFISIYRAANVLFQDPLHDDIVQGHRTRDWTEELPKPSFMMLHGECFLMFLIRYAKLTFWI